MIRRLKLFCHVHTKAYARGRGAIFDFRNFSLDYLRYIEVNGDNEARIWHEFPGYDKYKYEFEYVFLDKGKLFLEQRYLKRDTSEETVSRVELMIYTEKQIKLLFQKSGFTKVGIIPNWANESSCGNSRCFLVHAKK